METDKPTDRRAASAKRKTDIRTTKWPAITQVAYTRSLKEKDGIAPKLRSLALGKLRVGHAMLAMDKAMSEYNPKVSKDEKDRDIYYELRRIRKQMEDAYGRYPIEIV